MWLSDAKVTNLCFNSTDPQVGLGMYKDRLTLKCYMADTGLLISQALLDNRFTSHELYKSILFDKLEINEGMFMQNIVSQMLISIQHKLYFYSRYDKSDSHKNIEIDFLIKIGQKISPIEVKSSRNLSHTSLNRFKEKFHKKIGNSYMISPKDLQIKDDIICLPVYMTIFL